MPPLQPKSCVYACSQRSVALGNDDEPAASSQVQEHYLWIEDSRSPEARRIATQIRSEGFTIQVRHVTSVANFIELNPGVHVEDFVLWVPQRFIHKGGRVLGESPSFCFGTMWPFCRMRWISFSPSPSSGEARALSKSKPKGMNKPPSKTRRKGLQHYLDQFSVILQTLLVFNVVVWAYLNHNRAQQMISSISTNEQLAFLPEGMFAKKKVIPQTTPQAIDPKQWNIPFVEVMKWKLCDECKAAEVKGAYTCEDRIERFFEEGGDFSAFVKAQDDVSKEFVKRENKISCAACDPKTCKIAM